MSSLESSAMGKPEFGDKVTFQRKMYRNTRLDQGRNRYGQRKLRFWEPLSYDTPDVGVFLGMRTVQEGYREYDSDCGHYFVETGPRRTVAVVCTGPGKKPIYVDPEGLEVAA
ncbi:MAG: hypothetical protein AAGI11_15055 [Pseudomonadota bacterium]